MKRLTRFLLAVCLLGGCSGEATSRSAPAVVDSAGVRVIHHGMTTADQLVVAEEPEFVIGRDPAGDDELYRVRGGVFLADGGVAIANGGSDEILYFAENGDLVGRVGGEGEGPNEFRNILWVQSLTDGELAVFDGSNVRITYLDRTRQIIRSQRVLFEAEPASTDRALVGRGFPIGTADSDRVLAVPWAVAKYKGVEGTLPLIGELRNYVSDLSEFTMVDSVRFRTWYEVEQEEGPPISQIFRSPQFVFSANHAWTAYSDAVTHRVTVLEDGRPSYVLVEARERVEFSRDSVSRAYHHAADSLPAYSALQVDSDGRVWVRSSGVEGTDVTEWRVFSEGGLRVEAIELPASTLILDGRGDLLLLLERDDLDVESITARRVRRVAS